MLEFDKIYISPFIWPGEIVLKTNCFSYLYHWNIETKFEDLGILLMKGLIFFPFTKLFGLHLSIFKKYNELKAFVSMIYVFPLDQLILKGR